MVPQSVAKDAARGTRRTGLGNAGAEQEIILGGIAAGNASLNHARRARRPRHRRWVGSGPVKV